MVRKGAPAPSDPAGRHRIRPWRFVAGIVLHFAVPAYLVWLAVALLPLLARGGNGDQLAAAAGRASLSFLIVYAVFLVAISLATRAFEPVLVQARARRLSRDPGQGPRQSQARLRSALATAAGLGTSAALRQAIERLRSAPWYHDDQRFQAVSADLARAVQAFAAAYQAGAASARSEIEGLATRALERLAEAVEQLGEAQRRLDHGDAHAIARYIELRYHSSDFAGEQNH
jgi:hypothetical protein